MKGDIQITIEEKNIEDFDDQKYKLYEIDDSLYCVDNTTGDIYSIDFNDVKDDDESDNTDEEETSNEGNIQDESLDDNTDESDNIGVDDPNLKTNKKHAINNIEKGGCDMDFEMKETSETKPDGSEAMKERRITQCMEESGKDRKACTEMVRKEMHKKNAEAVNPEDMIKEEAKVEEEKEEEKKEEDIKEEKKDEDKKEEKKDTIEICSEEYDFLKKQVEELKNLKTEKEDAENELKSFKADFLKFKKRIDEQEANEIETERQVILKRISHDFDIPEEEMEEDTIKELEKFEKRLVMALKRNNEEEEKETFGDTEDYKEIGDRIHKRYFLEV